MKGSINEEICPSDIQSTIRLTGTVFFCKREGRKRKNVDSVDRKKKNIYREKRE